MTYVDFNGIRHHHGAWEISCMLLSYAVCISFLGKNNVVRCEIVDWRY